MQIDVSDISDPKSGGEQFIMGSDLQRHFEMAVGPVPEEFPVEYTAEQKDDGEVSSPIPLLSEGDDEESSSSKGASEPRAVRRVTPRLFVAYTREGFEREVDTYVNPADALSRVIVPVPGLPMDPSIPPAPNPYTDLDEAALAELGVFSLPCNQDPEARRLERLKEPPMFSIGYNLSQAAKEIFTTPPTTALVSSQERTVTWQQQLSAWQHMQEPIASEAAGFWGRQPPDSIYQRERSEDQDRDWNCVACGGAKNFCRRGNCYRCLALRPPASVRMAAAASSSASLSSSSSPGCVGQVMVSHGGVPVDCTVLTVSTTNVLGTLPTPASALPQARTEPRPKGYYIE